MKPIVCLIYDGGSIEVEAEPVESGYKLVRVRSGREVYRGEDAEEYLRAVGYWSDVRARIRLITGQDLILEEKSL